MLLLLIKIKISIDSQFNRMTTMYQCSLCTGACCTPPKGDSERCGSCSQGFTHVCRRCQASTGCATTPACVGCTKRPHICISKCSRQCVVKKGEPAIQCECKKAAKRVRVKKEGKNNGRYFYSCYDCGFFKWDD
jgi:hypothetical protein